nr:putative ribonuclease H-like domain-containing protein [Tanacetum cinerariifolium]
FDDLYNNLRVFERDVKGTTASSSNSQNVAFVSADNTSSTNDVSTAYSVSSPSVSKSQKEVFASYTDEVIHSFFANQSGTPQLDCNDLEQINDDDLKEIDLKWQDDSKALVTIDGEAVDWSGHVKENTQNFTMMAYSSSNSGSDNKVQSCSKTCAESYARLKKLYDEQRDKLVLPPMTGNYMPSGLDVEIDYSKFTYGPKQTSADESDAKTSENAISDYESSVEPSTPVPEPVVNESKVVSKPKAVSEPKVWTYAPIIEEYESDSDDDSVSNVQENIETPSFAFTDSVKHVKSPRENVKETSTPNHYPKIKTHDRHSDTRIGLGYTRKSCFVCGSFSHLIRDCDFHEKRMAKQAAFTKSHEKGTGQQAHRPVWNNVKRVNNQNRPQQVVIGERIDILGTKSSNTTVDKRLMDPHKALKDKGIVDNGCSKHMTWNKAHLTDYQEFKGGSVAFGGSNGKITVLLKIPKQHNMYSFNLKNIDPSGDLSFLIEKALIDESNKWYRRLGHVNFKNINKLVNKNLVRGYLSRFLKMTTPVLLIRKESNTRPLVRPRQFSWVYFLKSKDETTPILKDFIRQAENQFNHKVNTIRSDNGIEFKNHDLIEFCGLKEIKREYSNAKTPQQNKVAKRKNMTLIEAVRTLLEDSFLPTTFWAEAVNTACYVLNRVLVTKPQNKTPYELLTGRQPIISYLRPFGFDVTILNTINQLGKFDGKYDSWFLVGYFLNSKAFRVYNLETNRVEKNLHNQANKSAGPQEANHSAGTQANADQGANLEEIDLYDEHFVLPIWFAYSTTVKSSEDKIKKTTYCKLSKKPVSQVEQIFQKELEKLKRQEKEANDAVRKEATHETQDVNTNNTNLLNDVSTPVSVVGPSRALNDDEPSYPNDPSMPYLEDIYASPSAGIFTDSSYDDEDFPFEKKAIGTKWVYRNKKDKKGVVVRNKARLVAQGHRQEEGIDYDEVFASVARIKAIRIFLVFASYMGFIVYQMDVKSAFMYGTIDEELYVTQPPGFVDPKFPNKVYKIVKALYGLHQAPRAWYATLSTFLEKNRYRRGAINKTLFIKQHKKDIMLVQVYVDDIIFGSTKKSWCDEFEELMKNRFQMSSMGELTFFLRLQVKQKEDGIFISEDKYVAKILKKFDFLSVKTASTLIETQKPLVKDEEVADVDVHLYRSMIGSLMYLTASRLDIMFAVCAYSRFQVTSKTSHLQHVKRVFRYLKGQPKLGLWYPEVSSFDLEAYSDSDYAGANLDKKSITGGCQFLGRKLISWQCKKQTIMATSTTEAKYVAAVDKFYGFRINF